MAIGPTLTVTQHTTVDQISRFMTDHASGNQKILGKRDPVTGNTVLYVGGKTSLLNSISGKAAQRKETAKAAVFGVLHASLQSTKDGRTLSKSESRMISDLGSSINNRRSESGRHGLRSGVIAVLASAVKGSGTLGTPKLTGEGPQRTDLGPTITPHLTTAANGLSTALQNGTSMQTVAETLGDQIVLAFQASHPNAGDRLAFSMSNGSDLKTQLLDALKTALGGQAGDDLAKSPDVRDALDQAFNRAASQMLPNFEVIGQPITLNYNDKEGQAQTVDLAKISLDTPNGPKEFEPIGFLGTGSYANVFSYRATDGSNEVIAYKIAHNDSPEAIKDVGGEVLSHSDMVGAGHSNVVGLKGAIRTPDGRIGIAMEVAPNGDAMEFSQKLKASIGNGPGQVNNAQAELIRLTLFKDMAQGLSHIQETQDMIHLDFKSPNCLIGNDGTLKVADFGTSTSGDDFKLAHVKIPDNPAWLAPEVLLGKSELDKIRTFEKPVVKLVANSVTDQIKSAFPQIKDDVKKIELLKKNILNPHTTDDKDSVVISNKSDTWALGMAASDLFTGTYFGHGEAFMSEVERKLTDFSRNPFNQAVAPLGPTNQLPAGALLPSTGNQAIDGVLNQLLDPVPTNRPDISVALQNGIFTAPGVGSPEVRTLILAIASGDPNRIDQAKVAFDLALNPPLQPPQGGLPPLPNLPQQDDE